MDARFRLLSAELGSEPGSEPRGGLDLDFADRDALDVESEWNADASTKRD